jgi:hypothetical protein
VKAGIVGTGVMSDGAGGYLPNDGCDCKII